MRHLIIILKLVLTILLFFNIFTWLIAQGSGHNIPSRTNLIFGIRTLVLLVLLAFIFLGKRINKIK
jgi:hypothetical protein